MGQSPFHSDDRHLHNLLNHKLKIFIRGNTLPNSLTGLIIVLISTLPAMIVFAYHLRGTLA